MSNATSDTVQYVILRLSSYRRTNVTTDVSVAGGLDFVVLSGAPLLVVGGISLSGPPLLGVFHFSGTNQRPPPPSVMSFLGCGACPSRRLVVHCASRWFRVWF